MFENVINPVEGRWIRVAPFLTMVAIVIAFVMSLAVVISAVETSHLLTQLPKDAPAANDDRVLMVTFAR